MSEQAGELKKGYPYMSPGQFNAIRARLRQSRPSTVNRDWLASVLDISEKAAGNLLPQLRTLGLVGADGVLTGVADDLRVDETYAAGCQEMLEAAYPVGLREAFHSADAELSSVANWFIRNAKTGERMANFQARLYLHILGGELPGEQEKAKGNGSLKPVRKRTTTSSKKPTAEPAMVERQTESAPAVTTSFNGTQPSLHIDVQIHIAADASEAQIETIFSSMAKHLYGR